MNKRFFRLPRIPWFRHSGFYKSIVTAAAIFPLVWAGSTSAEAIEITHVEATNVTASGFTVFWQADESATPSLSVFADSAGFEDLDGTVRIEYFPLNTGDVTLPQEYAQRQDRRHLQDSLKANGLFLARVTGCQPGTNYHIRVGATNAANESAEAPAGNLLPVRTAAETAFLAESLQVMVEFPEGNADGLVATLASPAAAHPLAWTVGDAGFPNRAFFNLSDLIDPATNTNLQPVGPLPLIIRLHRPGGAETDDEQELAFADAFVVADVADLIFSEGVPPQLVHGFAFASIGTQTAGVPFRVTIRALDALGNPLTEFTGVADLSASGNLLRGAGQTPAFVDGVLADYLVALSDTGEHTLEAALGDGSASGTSAPFRVTGSYDRWLISQLPNAEDRENPVLAGKEADPWGTGVPNLLAYAIGTDSKHPDFSRLPRPVMHEITLDGGTEGGTAVYLAITYARSIGAGDVIFVPEVSDDLATWRSGPQFTEEVEALNYGTYELVTVRDRVPFDAKAKRFMRLRVRSGQSFASWQAQHFTGDRFFDADWSGATADPAGDGIANLLKYALRLEPHANSREGLPRLSTVGVGLDRFLTLSYERSMDATDIDYIVEVSNDLTNWHSGSGHTETVFTLDFGTHELVLERDLTPLGGKNQRFIRLRVERR